MKSQIQRNIIANEKLVHNGTIEAKKLYDIAKNMDISIQKLGDLFQIKRDGRAKINRQKGCVKVKLYTELELQEIKEKIKQELKNVEEINQKIINQIKNKYKIGDGEIKKLFNISSNQFIKIRKREEYKIKNTIHEEININELKNSYKYKAYIYKADIETLKNKYKFASRQLAKMFKLTIEQVRGLERGQTRKVRIYLYNKKDIEKIIKSNQDIVEKQRCTLEQLEKIIQKEEYDKEIILDVLGITNQKYYNLQYGKSKTIPISNYEVKQKVELCLLDMEKLYGRGKKEYKIEELQYILNNYGIDLEEFIEYSNPKNMVRKMYRETILYNNKIQMNPKTRMTNKFFEENREVIIDKVNRKVNEFCSTHRCYHQKEDYMQSSYEYLILEGGYITENMRHNVEEAVKMLGGRVKANLISQHYKNSIELRIDIEYQGKEIAEDQNKNYIDTRFSPEEILDKKEEINELHRIILRNIQGKLEFALEMPEVFLSELAFHLEKDEKEIEQLKEQIGLIILQNDLVKVDSKGRIIRMNG